MSHNTNLMPSINRDKCGPGHRPRVHRWLLTSKSWRYGSHYNLVEPAGTRTGPFFQLSTYLHRKGGPLIRASSSFTANKCRRRIQLDCEYMQWYENLSILLVAFLEINVEVRLVFSGMWWGWWNHEDQRHSIASGAWIEGKPVALSYSRYSWVIIFHERTVVDLSSEIAIVLDFAMCITREIWAGI